MSSSSFLVTEHTIPCQHIREYADGVKDERSVLQLAVKEYRPLNNLNAEAGSVTIIATHANGFPKETYEPLWESLVQRSTSFKIRAIWIADCSNQGVSGVKNEDLQGDDPSWFDHSRDLLQMINHFRHRMPHPMIGIGHCIGTAQLVFLSHIHPRLFHSLVLLEPVIQDRPPAGPNVAMLSSFRTDLWPSRADAVASMKENRFFRSLDPRVLDRYLEFGLRHTPTALYPVRQGPSNGPCSSSSGDDASAIATKQSPPAPSSTSVTLTTTKHQEAWTYVRPNFSPTCTDLRQEHLVSPDQDPAAEGTYVFIRPEAAITRSLLLSLRPAVLWLYGSRSPINVTELMEEKIRITGTGRGGSGGAKLGKVKQVVLQGGHLVPLERGGLEACAAEVEEWIAKEVDRWEEEKNWREGWSGGKSERGGLVLSREWLRKVRLGADVKRPAGRNGREKL